MSWQPSAAPVNLRARADLLTRIRQFFAARSILEVETPLLASAGVTDPALEPFVVQCGAKSRYLQTSPEYAMKRLLAGGAPDIYQICKAFRAGEIGRRHNPEYTLLEWYRLDFDHYALLREVAELICSVTGADGWQSWPYRTLFQHLLNIDPMIASDADLRSVAQQHCGEIPPDLDRDELLDVLMSHVIEPAIAGWGLVFVLNYPVSQSSLARKIIAADVTVGARFEAYFNGFELANGYWEASDASDLRKRFEADNTLRKRRGLVERPIDEQLLAAMTAGMPDCAGVALGVDRLLACRLGQSDIRPLLAFDWSAS